MKQLKMIRCGGDLKIRTLPEGYAYQNYSGSEEEIQDWLTICRHGLIAEDAQKECFTSAIEAYPDLDPQRDLFFVLDDEGRRVATTAAVLHKNQEGYIHMVAALPACRGLGIGHAMLYHALAALSRRGSEYVTLTTDDHRLAAIKTYLDAGFAPVLYPDSESDMKERWDRVIDNLGYAKVAYVTESSQ